ncbi:PAS domain S-box-containing protein [Actinorugispora endophytica]|uniref:histidine kinase n=1 Tax=Actinorugispora endophytica TaxID=1605990 RepID=A0A4R6UYC2_9ACTN|nr:PAS domain S-box-containing protein [Actinorugispora endophytica]
MADAVVVLDTDQRVVQWNKGAERMFGWTLAEVIGYPVPMVPDDRMAEYHAVLERVRVSRPISLTTRRVHHDGGPLEVRASFNRLTDVHGAMAGWVCVFHPHTMTPSEGELEQLHLAERAQLVRRLTDVMTDINADLGLVEILDGIVRSLTDLTGADAGGFALIEGDTLRLVSLTRLSDHLRGFETSLKESLFGELLASGKKVLLATDDTRSLSDLIWSDLDGLHTIALGVSDVQGRPYGALYALYSRRRVSHVEMELLELMAAHAGVALGNAMTYRETVRQRAHEHAIVDASADGISVLDHSGRVRKWNRAAAELTGYGLASVIGRPPPFPLPVEPGQLVKYRMGNGRWLEILVADISGTRERVVDFRDISPAKELEEQKDLFLATAGHELRTPLTVVRGLSSTLAERWDEIDEDERRGHVRLIADRAKRMARLVDHLLLGAKAGSRQLPVRNRVFDVRGSLREALAAFVPLLADHELRLELPATLPEVFGDPDATDVIISQLLENAFKYSPEGGAVSVSAGVEDQRVVVTVADEGVGIDSVDTKRIFERFVQGESGDRRRFGGFGLGLYIVQRLAEAQNGHVSAHPNQPHGTRMRFTLQCVPDSARGSGETVEPPVPDGNSGGSA